MSESFFGPEVEFGTPELQLPEQLRGPLQEHLEQLRERYLAIQWAQRVGFGERPALIVIDLALNWTKPGSQMGSHVDPVVDATCRVLASAREAGIPIFFSSYDFDPDEPPPLRPHKFVPDVNKGNASVYDLDPRLERRPHEKLFRKKFASCFKGTYFEEMLSSRNIDTLIVTGLSTSHCVYATCRDATDSYRVIVPREAVGERCQIMHMVNLLDIDIDLGDVLPMTEVIDHLEKMSSAE